MRRWLLILAIALLGMGLLFILGCTDQSTGTDTTMESTTDGATTNTTAGDVTLAGPIWKLTAMAADKTGSGVQPVAGDINATIEFGADGMYFAQAPVNTVRGPYTLDGDKLTLADGAMTQMLGIDEAQNAAENTFVGLLARVATFKITGTTLSLFDDSGAQIMEFTQ